MKTRSNENNKNSAAKKIIPAVGMLALSATMLSTSTYAWFTMNKEVQMTGLNMTATVGEGMEISLASVDASDNITAPTTAHPDDTETEKGWKSAVVVDEYYSTIGKFKPASSTTGVTLFDAVNSSDAGRKASKFTDITSAENAKVKASLRDKIKTGTEITVDEANSGYYVDIPVYLRTNKSGTDSEDIYYKMIISPLDKDGKASTADTDTLYKAVRVAFMAPDGKTNLAGEQIFAVYNNYYESRKAVSAADTKSDVTVNQNATAATGKLEDITAADSGLDIPLAKDGDNYGHLDFTVRVWLEGESASCINDNAGQSWNIDLAFSLGEFDTATTSEGVGA